MTHDRITKIYEGTVGTPVEQDRARNRLHWACARVAGRDVVDIGCGQGMATVLLAREGHAVVGIDRTAEVIDFARERLAVEEEAVRARTAFEVEDARTLSFEAGRFDSVLLLHILDRQLDMTPVLDEARRVLRDEGRLVVTVPYGGAAGVESKDPIYLQGLLSQVTRRFAVEDLDLVEDSVGLVLAPRRTRGRVGASLLGRALEVAEQRLGEQDRRVADHHHRLTALETIGSGESAAAEAPVQRRRITELMAEVARAAEGRDAYADERDAAREVVARLEAERDVALRVLGSQAVELSDEARTLRRELDALAERLPNVERERDVLARRVTELEQAMARQAPQLDKLQALRTSRSYKLMSRFWRIRAIIRRPWRGRGAPRLREANALNRASRDGEDVDRAGTAATQAGTATRAADTGPEADRRRFLAGGLEPVPRVEPRALSDLRVAAVLGGPLRAALDPACELVTFRPDNWRYVLEARPPHVLVVESTWLGNRRSWQYRIGDVAHPDGGDLDDLLRWCTDSDIPTIFWATRPAAELAPFVRAGRAFDHVFVADIAARGLWDGAELLPLAIQPALHHPGTEERSTPVTYLGGYSNAWPFLSRSALELILDAALPHGLHVLNPERGLPPRFAGLAEPRTGVGDSLHALRRTRAVVNIAPRDPEGTMVPGAVLEALACGASVICPPHPAARALLDGAVHEVSTSDEAETALRELLTDEAGRCTGVEKARRTLLSEHTYAHRLATLAGAAGYRLQA